MAVEDSVADNMIVAFVDRILRMKAEEDAIKADIKEIYAEAHGNGFNKTRLGEIVTYLRKVEKDKDGVAEAEAVRDLYLTAYFRGKNKPHAHAYARAAKSTTQNASVYEPFDPVTGEFDTTPKITEQQDAPHPASDLTASPSLSGQVATNPEVGFPTSNELPPASRGTAGEDDLRELAATVPGQIAQEGDAPLEASAQADGEGLPGQTAHLSTELQKPMYPAPGVVTTEHTPPEPVKWHPYAQCFPTVLGDDLKALEADIHTAFGGVHDHIVKIGNLILDGRARYGIARSLMIDYPVVQYDGSDPLIDVIAWNLASRQDRMTSGQIAATAKALCKLEPSRTDDIMQAFGLETAEAAQ